MSLSNLERSEDVHDFLQRIKEIGKQRNQEDEERNRKLEEAIIQGRKERQARRAERARSISPTKTSPAENLLRNRYSVPQNLSFSEFPQLCAKDSGSELQQKVATDVELISSSSEIPLSKDDQRTLQASSMREKEDMSPSPNAAVLRSPTLSWNRRYSSRAINPLVNRQKSLVALENVTKYQDNPLDLSLSHEGSQSCSQEQNVQTPDSSNLQRNNQVQSLGLYSPASDDPRCDDYGCSDNESRLSVKISSTSHGGSPHEQKKNETKDHQISFTKDFSDTKDLKNFPANSTDQGAVSSSPTPLILHQKPQSPHESKSENRNLALFATSKCISPERFNQSSSPTKGMGGFVQSAMMRRNDSVNKKRWSANNSPNINKTKSVPNIVLASSNSKHIGPKPETELHLSNISYSSLDRSNVTYDRPLSSASTRSDFITSSKCSSIENQIGSDVRVGNVQRFRSVSPNTNDPSQEETTPPISPSRTMDRRRWSPTKSSWLEAVLNKPDLFKQRPKTIQPPQQPAWMSEISKARQRPQTDVIRSSSPAPKHEVNIGGLMRSRPTCGPAPVVNFPGTLNPGFATGTNRTSSGSNIISSRPESRINVKNSTSSSSNMTPTLPSRPKIDELPKKDYRANLKPRKPLGSGNKIEPELKNVFVQLRPTKTQSYVAPDELRNNITRGKASLNVTGGPRKSEQKDEFKEAILKKKEDFKKAQLEGKGISRTSSGAKNTTLPEALVKQRALGRSDSVSSEFPINIGLKSSHLSTSHSRTASVPGNIQSQTNEFVKITDRVSTDLTRLLSQETNLKSSHKPRSFSVNPVFENSASNSKFRDDVPKLIHLTKERDRGPRRKPPSINRTSNLSERLASLEKKPNIATDSNDVKMSSEVMLSPANSAKVGPEFNHAVIHPSLSQSENAQALESEVEKLDTPPIPFNEINPIEKVILAQPPEASKIESHDIDQLMERQFSENSLLDQNRPKSVDSANSTLTFPQQSEVPESPSPINMKQSDQEQSTHIISPKEETDERSYQESKTVEETPTHQDIQSSVTRVKKFSGIQSHHENNFYSILNHTDSTVTKSDELISKISHNVTQTLPSPMANLTETAALSTTPPPTSTSQSFDCCTALTRFFDRTRSPENFDFDTLNLLSSHPEENFKTTSLQVDVFLFSSDGNKKIVPSNQERIFFEENTYICMHKHKNMNGKILTEVFLWVGDEISTGILQEIEDHARAESKVMGSDLLTIRQGKETSQFFVALGGFIIVQRGSSNKYNSLAPRILCARNYHGHIAFDEADFSSESLCSGFSYLISTNCGKCFLWKGRGTSVEELTCAKLVGMDFGLTGEIEEVEEGKEPSEFLQIFGDNVQMPDSADYWELKPKFPKYRARLFVADESSKEKISEIKPFNQQDLSGHQKIYIVDVFFEIYILIGSEAQSQYSAFHNALIFVQEYSILAAGMEERPHVPPVKVILSGITRDLKAAFRKWKNGQAPSHQCQSESSLLMLPLTEVLEALRD
ncbi:putative gelsolin repeat protein [Golovinomyces cichoracearum]|uniref:Putative gelsolin repeat protein n=1 Tax=Golovinomyces cichoracearum TaxID=62708 RepID=A0A420HJP7_9PEZI|nr:putative gelsolin repeat protein [Golovinomyces cichoracearum]